MAPNQKSNNKTQNSLNDPLMGGTPQVNFRRMWFFSAIIIALLFGASLWAWWQLPADASIPVHWNAAGEADRYGGKFEGLFLLPLITAAVVLLLGLVPRIDPRRANIARSAKAYTAVWGGVLLLMLVLHLAAIATALGTALNISTIVLIATGLLFLVMGNYMGKVRQSYMFGIRTPWTLHSQHAWNRTHRLGGRLLVLVGLLTLVSAFWNSTVGFAVMTASLLITVAVLFVYSYQMWKQDPDAGATG